jgi:hypothetical protein
MIGIVVLDKAMAFEAQRNRIVEVVSTVLRLWNQVMNHDINSAGFLAYTAMTIRPQQDSVSHLFAKWHQRSPSNLAMHSLKSPLS